MFFVILTNKIQISISELVAPEVEASSTGAAVRRFSAQRLCLKNCTSFASSIPILAATATFSSGVG